MDPTAFATLVRREPMHRWGWNLLVTGILFAFGVVGPTLVAAQSPTSVPAPYGGTASTAVLVSATHAPLAVLGSDGMRHLEYDLLVTNTFLAPVRLTHIDVRDGNGRHLQQLDGEELLSATQPLLGAQPQREIPPSGTVAVVMDVAVPPDPGIDRLRHTIAYALPSDAPDQALIGSLEVDGPDLPVSSQSAVVITPPLSGAGWLALNGCCAASSVHRFERVAAGTAIAKAEMFAIDWVQLRDGQLNAGDGTRSEDYFGFAAEVHAVADGTVVYARDGMPEQVPGEVVGIERPEDFGGNQVMVAIAPRVYAFYAHLKTGSVAVEVGDQVTAGQVIGHVGNSGHSTAPHLHFGLLDTPNATTGNGVPMVLDRYVLAGTIDPAVLVAASPPPDGRLPIDSASQRSQTETLPLYLTVADFP
jgi:hypothetical protein